MLKFNELKQKRAITLVALILTIIVMLILVGVSISVLINSNLIGTAKNAGERTETAYGEEGQMGQITVGNTTYNSIDEYLAAQGKNQTPPSVGTMPAITAGQRAAENSTYSDGTNTAVIPAKFTVSGAATEKIIEGGLVIYLLDYKLDEEGNKTTEAMTDADIAAINWNDGTRPYKNLSTIKTILEDNTNYEDLTTWRNALQTEYNNIVKSVYENEGFYVGRYETSGMAQSTSSYDVVVVAGTLPSVSTGWYHMYAQQKKYASSNSLTVGSTMIQGAAYDQVMKFINTATYSATTAGNVGHSTVQGAGTRYQTGGLNYNAQTDAMTDYKAYNDVSKNIFDLEGNVLAWTTEASNTDYRVIRGRRYRKQLVSEFS